MANAPRVTDHAVLRYVERRNKPALYIAADIYRARPVTKNKMRKINRRTKSGQHLLLTPDNFAFVACGKVIITCFQIGDKKWQCQGKQHRSKNKSGQKKEKLVQQCKKSASAGIKPETESALKIG